MADLDPRVLADYLSIFENTDFSPGHWVESRRLKNGIFTAPYASLSSAANEFVSVAYENGWVLLDFDWVKWKDTKEAKRLYSNPNALKQATPRQLAQLLTVFIRQDRFVEGGLLGDFKSGHILAIVRRAAELVAQNNNISGSEL